MSSSSKFIPFKQSVEGISLPEKFTFPFYYEPHLLSLIASKELQEYIETQNEWLHNFGLIEGQSGMVIGKMFGVLVVQNQEGKLGYLAAFSGKLADANNHTHFVPSIFDMLLADGFYKQGEVLQNELNLKIEQLEHSEELIQLKTALFETVQFCDEEMKMLKATIKSEKEKRRIEREKIKQLPDSEQNIFLEELRQQSLKEQYYLKDTSRAHRKKIEFAQNNLNQFLEHINDLKKERKQRSIELQDQLFRHYNFLNAHKESSNVLELFKNKGNGKPPAGAGECCAPKLLQYAYQNELKPIAMAEFWWGASPASEIRSHQNFYPACKGKCEPILGHMMKGLDVDPNPMEKNPAEGKELKIIYEDDAIVVVDKPAEFLSVPGKNISDSVLKRMEHYLPKAEGPLLVHRLDMSTSGILLVAKNKEAYIYLQNQFIRRTIKKRYVALLEGVINQQSGSIDLPLRVDLDDRPRQLVCYEYGKSSKTEWKLIEIKDGRSKVFFYPLTGRTHQLRVHSAHPKGLGMPIVGDDLYGVNSDRLYLHAEQLTFKHPKTKEIMTVSSFVPF